MSASDRTALPERPRVFLGTADPAWCLSAMAKGFRELGCDVTTMVTHAEAYRVGTTYDVVRGRELLRATNYEKSSRAVRGVLRRADLAMSAALNGLYTPSYLRHDLFVLVSEPWAPAPLVYSLLRRLGKRLVVYFLGSDARHVSAFSQEYGVDTSTWGPGFRLDPLETKIRRIRWAELNATAIYSVPDQAGLQIRPYRHAHLPVDVEGAPHIPGRRRPRIVHAPSRTDVKGTSHVLAAVDELRREGEDFDFELLTGMRRSDLLQRLADADVLVDELLLHGPGVLSAEAMLLGCAVATRVVEPPHTCFSAPVCAVRPGTLVPNLRRLVADVGYRTDLARRGADWARSEFAPAKIAAQLLCDVREENGPDYVPRFYLEHYRPPTTLSRVTRALDARVVARFRPEVSAERGSPSEPRTRESHVASAR